jgi:hypothetical protein
MMSIPRPPKSMYSPKKEILEALIDGKVKYFSLDKVKLLLNDSDKTI